MITSDVQAGARRSRHWLLALVLAAFICSNHWAVLSADATGSTGLPGSFAGTEMGGGRDHAIDCVPEGALLLPDPGRFDVAVIVPADAGQALLAPIDARLRNLPLALPGFSPAARRAFLQVFVI